MPAPRPRRISDIMPKIQNVAQTSQFLVKFVLPRGDNNRGRTLRTHMRRKGINDRFIAEDVGLLCSDAVLPGSAMAALNTAGDYQGMIEKFAHTRNFTQVNFDFYVDNQYKSLKFLEHWMEYISGQSSGDPSNDAYHFRMAYPSEYKSNDTRVVKFEKNHFQFLEYRFIGLFPLSLNSTKVAYQNSQVLKASATFSYDRYVCGESNSLARALGINLNNARGRGGNEKIDFNNNTQLNNVLTGLPLLNQGTRFGYTFGANRTVVGTDSTLRQGGVRDSDIFEIQ